MGAHCKGPATVGRRRSDAEQARLTQRRIVDAAHRLFVEQGYGPTTMAAAAAAAGVSAQTVYNAFGSKPALLKRVYDIVLGDVPAGLPVVITGIGKTAAATATTQALAGRAPDDLVVLNIGTAGALRPGLTGLFTPRRVLNHDLDATWSGRRASTRRS